MRRLAAGRCAPCGQQRLDTAVGAGYGHRARSAGPGQEAAPVHRVGHDCSLRAGVVRGQVLVCHALTVFSGAGQRQSDQLGRLPDQAGAAFAVRSVKPGSPSSAGGGVDPRPLGRGCADRVEVLAVRLPTSGRTAFGSAPPPWSAPRHPGRPATDVRRTGTAPGPARSAPLAARAQAVSRPAAATCVARQPATAPVRGPAPRSGR